MALTSTKISQKSRPATCELPETLFARDRGDARKNQRMAGISCSGRFFLADLLIIAKTSRARYILRGTRIIYRY
jgi:hypothetical protein